MKVYLKYSFIFDPAGGWSHSYQFENDLASYLRSCGYEAEFIQSNTKQGETMIYLDKVEPVQVEEKSQTPNQIFAKMTQRRGEDGKFKKPNT